MSNPQLAQPSTGSDVTLEAPVRVLSYGLVSNETADADLNIYSDAGKTSQIATFKLVGTDDQKGQTFGPDGGPRVSGPFQTGVMVLEVTGVGASADVIYDRY